MRFSPMSFLLGLVAAGAVPIVSRAFRPFAVEAAALALTVVDEGRRIVAEQVENFEDVMAEARVRREEVAAAAAAAAAAEGEDEGEDSEPDAEAGSEAAVVARPRRRNTGRVRSHVN